MSNVDQATVEAFSSAMEGLVQEFNGLASGQSVATFAGSGETGGLRGYRAVSSQQPFRNLFCNHELDPT